jgi:hypothetical protein
LTMGLSLYTLFRIWLLQKKIETHHNHRGDSVAHLSTMKLMVSKL